MQTLQIAIPLLSLDQIAIDVLMEGMLVSSPRTWRGRAKCETCLLSFRWSTDQTVFKDLLIINLLANSNFASFGTLIVFFIEHKLGPYISNPLLSNFQYYQVSDMDLSEAARPKKVYNVIEPNTNRVLEMRRLKALKDLEKRTQQEKARKQKEDQEKKNASLMRMRQDEKRLELKRREEEQRRRREEENESNTLTGRFGHMINDLNTNSTNLEFTISGMDLRPAQIKVLISNVQNNSSLKGLTMCRKKLTEVEGIEIADKLMGNEFLERLQLEGNFLGPDTLTHIAELLKTNDCIRLIDLQGNKLVKGPDDRPNYKGIDKLVASLEDNDTLLSLNLNNTGLDSYCSKKLREVMEHNSTIIQLDLENNTDMNIDDVLAIQDALIKNKQDYDDERYMEFIQRKRMRREEDISGVLLLNVQTKKLRGEAIDLNIKTKKSQMDEEWQEFLASEQLKKQKEIIRMEKEAASKKGKKKKK